VSGARSVSRAVGVPLASGIVALCSGQPELALERMLPVAGSLSRLGGSNAQRDLFSLLLIDAALRGRQRGLAESLLSQRLAQRPDNRWARERMEQLTSGRKSAA